MIRTFACVALALAVLQAASATAADAAHGQELYARDCGTCHAPGIHGRTTRAPLTRDELRVLVDQFRRRAKLEWTPRDIDDVVEHLDTMSYRLPPETTR